jgi:myo-inositol-1(or 4)-monophosphatase
VRDLVRELALALRERVLPQLRSHAGRAHEGEAGGGDVTFAIDAEAERELEAFLAEHAPDVAFYSEDRGLVEPSGGARAVLVVDPIDGTRPALAGLESCCVSVAAARLDGEPTMGDVSVGCIVEIPSGQVFLAERGAGIVEGPPVLLSRNERIDRMFWAYGFRGRPARPLVTGQLDAVIEPGPRLLDELPGMRAEFERVGGGAVLNNSPYDLAAAALILDEAGAILTDAYGRSLRACPLLGSSHEFQMSVVAAGNENLHRAVLEVLDAGFSRVSG